MTTQFDPHVQSIYCIIFDRDAIIKGKKILFRKMDVPSFFTLIFIIMQTVSRNTMLGLIVQKRPQSYHTLSKLACDTLFYGRILKYTYVLCVRRVSQTIWCRTRVVVILCFS